MYDITLANPSVWALFQQCAQRQKDAVALRTCDRTVTYESLEQSATSLAAWLSQVGVRPKDRVAVRVSDPVRAVEHFLALAKIGAAYVPLESTLPELLAWEMLGISNASHVVLDVGSELTGPRHIKPIPPPPEGFDGVDEEWPHAEPEPTDALYVMFTSGSTGSPKGVVITHAGVVRLARNRSSVRISPSDNILQLSSRAFDASTFEIWGALLNGATLTLVVPDFSIHEIGTVIAKCGVTMAWFTARLFDTLIDHHLDALAPLKSILFGGESHSFPHVERAFRELPSTVLIHGYGPTENTTFSTLHRVTEADLARGIIPIGKVIDESTIYVLDPTSLLPVEGGEHGILFVGGTGLAIGYTDAVLTTERFIMHPQLAERIYNTGDSVYQNSEGELVFVGRQDRQVKIRGYRIELDEIEARLNEHPKVSAAFVLYNQVFESNDLFAFYQSDDDSPLLKKEMVDFLSSKVPAFAIPSYFSHISELPLKSTGKIDIKRLVSEFQERHSHARSDGEENPLASIWKDLLNTNLIGDDTHFFNAGGDSLSALSLLLKVQALFQISLPGDFLAIHPYFGDFAREVFHAKSAGEVFKFSSESSSQVIYLVPWLHGSAYTYAHLARFLSIHGSVLSFNGIDQNGRPIPFRNIEELAHTYSSAIDTLPGIAISLCGCSAGGAIALDIAYQLEKRGIPVKNVFMLDTPEPDFYRQGYHWWPTLIRNYRNHLKPQRVVSKIRSIYRRRLASGSSARPTPTLEKMYDPRHWSVKRLWRHLLWRYHEEIMCRYQVRKPEAATIYLLRAKEQDLDRSWSSSQDLGWRRVIPKIRVHDVNGGHTSVLSPRYVKGLADTMLRLLGGNIPYTE
jgi:amino acid adenylation domain-containing protein